MRVIVIEDQALLRDGLVRLFTDKGHDVVGSASSAAGLEDLVDSANPDLVVLDIRMPPTFTDEGATAARTLKSAHPGLGVLLLSQHVDKSVVDLVAHPGFGYLLKDRVFEVEEFLDAALRVAGGGSALDPKVVAALVASREEGPLARLSDRERDVLRLMAEGLTNAGIAGRLFLSARTVEAHVGNLMTKLEITDSDEQHRRVAAVLSYLRATR
ncbi:LuxR C-terminal-related transcriptional regulator [Aeromicrobium sp.]|uniref:LuxR C-terminal-related transcriptional regulator n=1 Tax=Aeromicrobium sp. TaxID=1871063 RepID=UPI003D6C1453